MIHLERVATFAELARFARLLGSAAGIPHRVEPLAPADEATMHGAARGRTLLLARSAPLAVVVHELAHVNARDDHGPLWQAEVRRLILITMTLQPPTSSRL